MGIHLVEQNAPHDGHVDPIDLAHLLGGLGRNHTDLSELHFLENGLEIFALQDLDVPAGVVEQKSNEIGGHDDSGIGAV